MEDILLTQFEPETEISDTISNVWDTVRDMVMRLFELAKEQTRPLLIAFLLSCSANPLPASAIQIDAIEECSISILPESLSDETETKKDELLASLMAHHGDKMSEGELMLFQQVVPELAKVESEESLLIYNSSNHTVSADFLLPNEYELHVTVYFEEPNDKLVYSLEKEDDMISCRCVKLDNLYASVNNDIANNNL